MFAMFANEDSRPHPNFPLSRRGFLATTAATALASAAPAGAAVNFRPPRVAAVFTELRFRSHAYNILENFFEPYLFRGELTDPGVEVVSFYADQFPDNDMARAVSRKWQVPLYPTIAEALRAGTRELAVDAVLLIGEHGDYPVNSLGQKMYPRKQFFDEIAGVIRGSGRAVPIFNDKHLSYRWDWAKEMYDRAAELKLPLLAGSSVPLATRTPELTLPRDCQLTEAIAVHGGGIESYGFHGLELLQSFIERRRGGESGVAAVQQVSGEQQLAAAVRDGWWSAECLEAAMAAEDRLAQAQPRQPYPGRPAAPRPAGPAPRTPRHALLVEYRDGFRATVLQAGSDANRWNFACRVQGDPQPRATALFNGPWGNRCLFKALSHAIQHLFTTGRAPYPVERTLLVSGVLEAAMKSHQQQGKRLPTPHLDVAYRAPDWDAFRETGASWKRITAASPQPTTFDPGDARWVK